MFAWHEIMCVWEMGGGGMFNDSIKYRILLLGKVSLTTTPREIADNKAESIDEYRICTKYRQICKFQKHKHNLTKEAY